MPDTQGGEGLALVPGDQPLHGAGAFVGPDAPPEFLRIHCAGGRPGRSCGLRGTGDQGKSKQGKQEESHACYFSSPAKGVKHAFCLYANFCAEKSAFVLDMVSALCYISAPPCGQCALYHGTTRARNNRIYTFLDMVAIRLNRQGSKDRPFYKIVVVDSRSRRDGDFIEQVGTYNPMAEGENYTLNLESVEKWIANGAQPSETVASIIKKVRAAKA